MMLTFRAGKLTVLVVLLSLAAACSREQQDWRSAEAADTVEGYGQFLERHPESELATQAHARVAQLSEDREWQSAGSADTVDAYRQFLAQHPSGKWAQEARIRIENFSLGGSPASETSVVGASRAATAAGSSATTSVGPLRAPAGKLAAGPSADPEATSARAFPGEAAAAPPARQPAFSTATASTQSASSSPPPTQRSNASSSDASNTSAPRVASSTSSTTRASPSSSLGPARSPAVPAAYNSGQVGSPSSSQSGGYSVQLGAFSSESAATNQWRQLTGRFGTELRGLSPHVVSANTATGRLFRLQAQVADESRARAICDSLKKQSQACVPVLPY